jgi:rhamnulokinase
MVVSGPAEASALGNVMLQAVALGELETVVDGRAAMGGSLESELVTYEPRGGDAWAEAQGRYRELEAVSR